MTEKHDRPPILLVNRCFVTQDHQILLIKRSSSDSHNPGKWEVPGGKLDFGQDLSQALEREVVEETGLIVEPSLYPLSADSFIIPSGKYQGLTYVVLFGIAKLIGGELKLSPEHQDHRWVSPGEAYGLELTAETRKALAILAAHL